MSVSTTKQLSSRWFRTPSTGTPDSDSGETGTAEVTVVSRAPFDGGEHLIVSEENTGLVQLFLDAEGDEILADRATAYGRALAAGTPLGGGTLHGEMPAGLSGRVLTGRWNNSLLVFADDTGCDRVMVKVYRHPEPGPHPEVEVLSAIPSAHVPALLGHVTTEIDGETHTLATIQQFMDGADGFEHSLVHAEAQMFSHRVSGRFGETLRMVHDSLAMALPTTTVPAADVARRLEQRLDGLITQIPELEQHTDWVRDLYRDLSGEVLVQRIHGDLHLGQTLYDDTNWKFLDFEGNPDLPIAQRRQADAAVTDLAGVILSLQRVGQDQHRWIRMCLASILEGYGLPEGSPLLTSYVTDATLHDLVRQSLRESDQLRLPLQAMPYLREFATEGHA